MTLAKKKPAPDLADRYIVAEISKTWHPGEYRQQCVSPAEYVGHQFEQVCRHNAGRGYRLHSWKMVTVAHSEPASQSPSEIRTCIQETIVAVFEKEGASS